MDPLPRLLALQRYPDGAPYRMEAFDRHLKVDEVLYDTMVDNCRQGPVWDWVFSKFMKKDYERNDAVSFMGLCNAAWEKGASFVYGIFSSENLLVGVCEVKAADESGRAEVGYWLNADHRGLMTNAVANLVMETRKAGYAGLFAYTDRDNIKSQGVLIRNGFQMTKEAVLDRRGAVLDVYVFEIDY